MTGLKIAAMPAETEPARRLAAALDVPVFEIARRRFPDGESLVTAPDCAGTVIVYDSLDHPNEKLVELGLTAAALRDLGAARLVLAAPYLCYMRQDAAFHRGEAVAQRVIGAMLAGWFDRIVTIEPHLHRTRNLSAVFPDTQTTALPAASLLADMITEDAVENTLVVGPDEESRAWAASVARLAGAPCVTLLKARSGDRQVTVSLDAEARVKDKTIYFVDDIVSTGATMAAAARLLKERGAARMEALAVHALFNDESLRAMRAAGIDRIRSTDAVAHPTNARPVAPLLADALMREKPQ